MVTSAGMLWKKKNRIVGTCKKVCHWKKFVMQEIKYLFSIYFAIILQNTQKMLMQ